MRRPGVPLAVLIDTDVIVTYERSGEALELLLAEEERLISVITVSELLHGVHRADSRHRLGRAAFVEHVLAQFDAVPISATIARVHAEIGATLSARGDAIGTHDLWIGATAIAHGLGVATLNGRVFARISGLRVVTP